MPPLDFGAQRVATQRSNRRFHIAMGCVFSSFIVLILASVWVVVAREPVRRAAYLAECQGKGFSVDECQFLYAARRQQDADNATIMAIAAGVAVSQAALQRSYGR
jgi:hypothetical protein